jgi:hypothetical protein
MNTFRFEACLITICAFLVASARRLVIVDGDKRLKNYHQTESNSSTALIDTTQNGFAVPFDSGVLPYMYPGGGCIGVAVTPSPGNNYSRQFVVTGLRIALDSAVPNSSLVVQVRIQRIAVGSAVPTPLIDPRRLFRAFSGARTLMTTMCARAAPLLLKQAR